MKKLNSIDELEEAILLLEIKRSEEAAALKTQFKSTLEHLTPANLIKDGMSELISHSGIKEKFISTSMGLAAGYISKKTVVGSTHNPMKQILGTILQIGVTNLVSRNADGIRSAASRLLSNIFKKRDAPA